MSYFHAYKAPQGTVSASAKHMWKDKGAMCAPDADVLEATDSENGCHGDEEDNDNPTQNEGALDHNRDKGGRVILANKEDDEVLKEDEHKEDDDGGEEVAEVVGGNEENDMWVVVCMSWGEMVFSRLDLNKWF